MAKPYDLSKPLVALDHDSTLVAVVEMSGTSWLVLAIVPGIDRRPLQKLPVDENRLFRQLEIWREEAGRAGKVMRRATRQLPPKQLCQQIGLAFAQVLHAFSLR